MIGLNDPTEHYQGVDDSFLGCRIESIVVPLYKKIYLEADKAKSLVLNILNDPAFGYRFEAGFVFRFFLTSSRSFKNHVSTLAKFDLDVKNYLVQSQMPKFIWCGEIYASESFHQNQAAGLIVIDATEASENTARIIAIYRFSWPWHRKNWE